MRLSPVVVGLSLCRTEIRYAVRTPVEEGSGPHPHRLTLGSLPRPESAGDLHGLLERVSAGIMRLHRSDSDDVWTGPGDWSDEEIEFLAAPLRRGTFHVKQIRAGGATLLQVIRPNRHADIPADWIPAGVQAEEWTDPEVAASHPCLGIRDSSHDDGGSGGSSLIIHASERRLAISQFRGRTLMNATMIRQEEPGGLRHGLAARISSLPWLRDHRNPQVRVFGEMAASVAESVRLFFPAAVIDSGLDLAGPAGPVGSFTVTNIDTVTDSDHPAMHGDLHKFSTAILLSSHPDGADGNATIHGGRP